MCDVAGGTAAVFGNSSGAVLAVRAAAAGLPITALGLPQDMITGMRQAPMWAGLEAVAHTLAYDALVMGDSTLPDGLASSVKVPTLILTGGKTGEWAGNMADAVTSALPDSQHRTLDGQDHNVAWDILAPALRDFFSHAA
jgi:hypothetical protein